MRCQADPWRKKVEHGLRADDEEQLEQASVGGGGALSKPAAQHDGSGGADESHDRAGSADQRLVRCLHGHFHPGHCGCTDPGQEIHAEKPSATQRFFHERAEPREGQEVHGEMNRAEVQEQTRAKTPPFSALNRYIHCQ